jgi:hypothetical protein
MTTGLAYSVKCEKNWLFVTPDDKNAATLSTIFYL